MRTNNFQAALRRLAILAAGAALFCGIDAPCPTASSGQTPDPLRDREQLRDGEQLRDREQIRNRLQLTIGADPALDEGQRLQMREHLEACFAHGFSADQLESLFSTGREDGWTAQERLRLQHRIRSAAEADLPVELLVGKLAEARSKGVAAAALEGALTRIEQHLRTAQQVMNQAAGDGVAPAGDQPRHRRLVQEMAQHMWRGMDEDGLRQLREQARRRVREGGCSLEDLTAASAMATSLRELGVQRDRALRLAGDALRNGYQARQMHELRLMAAASERADGVRPFLDDLEGCLSEGMQYRETHRHMMQAGWLGPGEMHSPGGAHPGGDLGGGGPGGGSGGGSGGGGGGGGGGGR